MFELPLGTIPERVQRGIDLLNEKGPEDWPDRIVLEDFCISSTCRCVLGFVYKPTSSTSLGGFSFGKDALKLSQVDCERCGFDSDGYINCFYELQREWRRRLVQIQSERAKSAADATNSAETM